jgi:hypothetical protein
MRMPNDTIWRDHVWDVICRNRGYAPAAALPGIPEDELRQWVQGEGSLDGYAEEFRSIGGNPDLYHGPPCQYTVLGEPVDDEDSGDAGSNRCHYEIIGELVAA